MDFYLDEQIPKTVAEALDKIESHEGYNRVFSTATEFGKGISDIELFKKLKAANGILITNDLKIMTRRVEITALKDLGVNAFIISFPSGVNYELIWQTIFDKWTEIKKIVKKTKQPFICRIKMKGAPEML